MRIVDWDDYDLPLITTSKILKKNRIQYHEEGLFSEQIFGPVKNYTCQCGIYHGSFRSGGTCATCGVPIVHSSERRRRFAAIKLPLAVYNPILLEMIYSLAGRNFKTILNTLLTQNNAILYIYQHNDSYECGVEFDKDKIPTGAQTYQHYQAIDTLINSVVYADLKDKKWEVVRKNIKKLKMNYVLVLPPELRPSSQIAKNKVVLDDINKFYTKILILKETIEKTSLLNKNSDVEHIYFTQLQKEVNELTNFVLEKISKKTGLIRGNILGKRSDFSGRAVISPDPTLDIDECSLPYTMFCEIFKIHIAKELVKSKNFFINEAIEFINENIHEVNEELFEVAQRVAQDKVCILNRQPTLHRVGMLAFSIKINKGKTIQINPYVCTPIAGDFDGDTCAIYVPISEETIEECRQKLMFSQNLTLPSTGKLSTLPSQDMVLGIYALTSGWIPNIEDPWKEYISCFPSDMKWKKQVVTKKVLDEMLNYVNEHFSKDQVVKTLDNIKMKGFKYATLLGSTLSLDLIPDFKELRTKIYSDDNSLQKLLSNETDEYIFKNFKLSYMIKSGARGNIEQLKQLVLSRGYVSNFNGDIISTPVKSSFVSGLSKEEFFISTYGSRKGLLDVAINTGVSGYLSRKIVFAGASIELDENNDDCGTKNYLVCTVKNLKHALSLLGRWYYDSKSDKLLCINKNNVKELIGKTILLRSPIYCKSEKICKKCYGSEPKNLHSPYVGIIAAQSIGEVNTQLVLRTFHTSGVAHLNSTSSKETQQKMKQEDIVGDLTTVRKLFHVKEHLEPNELVSKLYEIYSMKKNILQVHFECIVSNMMFSQKHENTKWRLVQDQTNSYDIVSILQIPTKESWLMAIAFSHPKKHIIEALLGKLNSNANTIVDKFLLGEKF